MQVKVRAYTCPSDRVCMRACVCVRAWNEVFLRHPLVYIPSSVRASVQLQLRRMCVRPAHGPVPNRQPAVPLSRILNTNCEPSRRQPTTLVSRRYLVYRTSSSVHGVARLLCWQISAPTVNSKSAKNSPSYIQDLSIVSSRRRGDESSGGCGALSRHQLN